MHTVTCKTIPSHIWNIWDRNMQRDGENEQNETEGQRENKTRKDRETERDKWTRQKETKRNAMEYVWNIHTPDKKKKREAKGKTQRRTYVHAINLFLPSRGERRRWMFRAGRRRMMLLDGSDGSPAG